MNDCIDSYNETFFSFFVNPSGQNFMAFVVVPLIVCIIILSSHPHTRSVLTSHDNQDKVCADLIPVTMEAGAALVELETAAQILLVSDCM